MYILLAQLRSAGDRDYHNLTSTYLTANSILLAAIGIILTQGSITTNIVSMFLSVMGLFFCLQMFIAQGRFRSQNLYWERELRILEDKEDWNQLRLFSTLLDVRKQKMILPRIGNVEELKPNFGIKYHDRIWGARMKSLPFLFGVVFIFFLVWSVTKII